MTSNRLLHSLLVLLAIAVLEGCAGGSAIRARHGFDREAAMHGKAVRGKALSTKASASIPVPAGESFRGQASYYSTDFKGRPTASGESFDPADMTCAHQTLPFGTRLRVTLLSTGQSVEVRVNDRGPFKADRVLDLSTAAARRIGLVQAGVGEVQAEVLE